MPSMIAAPSQTAAYAEPDIQLASLWIAIKRGFKGLAITAVGIGALTYGTLSLMAPRYSSESQIEFVSKRSNPFPEGSQRPAVPDSAARLDQAAINTHARALLSSDLLLKVAHELKLRERAEFNSAIGPVDTWSRILRLAGIGAPVAGESEDERVLGVVRRQIEVAALKETRFIAIRFHSADAQLAADFVNLLADTYRATLVSLPVEETSKVVEAMQPKVEQLRKEVLDAEAAVESYRATSDQFRSGPQSTPVVDQRMAGLQDELLRAEAARNESEARWRTARELHRSGSAEVLPDVQKSALVQGLIQQRVRLERQIAESSAALLPGHPRMQQLNADVAGLRRQITAEVEKVVQGIEKDARSATIRVESVSQQIAALKSKVVDNSGNEARLKELDSVARAKRTELERLQKQLEDNRTVVNTRQVPIEAQVIARGMATSTAAFPRKGSSAALASAATFILGLAIVITRALISPPGETLPQTARSRRSPVGLREPEFEDDRSPPSVVADLADRLRKPIAMPPARAPHAASSGARLHDAGSALADLAQRLMNRTDLSAGARTLVTAETPGASPMAEARRLADFMAAAGKHVVLVAWSPSGRILGVASPSIRKPGINDLIRGTASFENVVSRVAKSTIHMIQAGSGSSDTSEVLDLDRLNLTLDALDEAYDQIVVIAELEEARQLFEAIEGRFDAAVMVSNAPAPEMAEDGSSVFLGFETLGIDVVHTPPPPALDAASGPSRQNRSSAAMALRASR